MKQFLQLLLISAIIIQSSCTESSQFLTESTPESVGMSALRLSYIDTMINHAIEQNKIPGAVILVARHGKIIYHKAFGYSEFQKQIPFRGNDIFRIASQTKAITSTAVMILWEQGKFNLDDPISMYIPEFKNMQVLDTFNETDSTYTTKPTDKEITIRHLLTHSSGLGYGSIDGNTSIRKIYAKAGIIDLSTPNSTTIEENIKKLATLPLLFNPGEKYKYSEGLDVLGYFIEVMSGLPLDEFLRINIFEPLDMQETWFYLPDNLSERLIPVQTLVNENWENYTTQRYNINYPVQENKTYFSGGAGLSGPINDYAKFLQMYLNQGEYNGKRILSRTTVDFMMKNQIGNLWENMSGLFAQNHYGLAFAVLNENGASTGGLGSIGTFSWGGIYNTQYFADPEEKIIGLIYKQTRNDFSEDTYEKFKQIVLASVND